MLAIALILSSFIAISEKPLDKSPRPSIILFTAKWCGPCGRMKREVITPLFPLLRKIFTVKIVDVDENKAVVEEFKRVTKWDGSIPHLCLVNEDNVVEKESTGYKDIGQFVEWVATPTK